MQPQVNDSANNDEPKVISSAQSLGVGSQAVQAVAEMPVADNEPTPASHGNLKSGNYVSNPFTVGFRTLANTFTLNPVPMLLPMIITALGIAAAFSVLIIVSLILPVLAVIIGIPIVVGAMISFVLIYVGYLVVIDSSQKGQQLNTKSVINLSLKKVLIMLLLMIVLWVIVFLGLLLLIIPGIILAVRLSLAPVILISENAGISEAINRSMKLTKGHFWEVSSSNITGSIYSTYGLLSMFIPVAFTAARYYDFKHLEDTNTPAPKPHKLNYFVPILAVIFVAAYIGLIALSPKAETNTQVELDNNTRIFEDDQLFEYESGTFEDDVIVVPDASEL